MPRQYANNPMNRSLGRVGMDHGTAVHSRSSGGGGGGGGGSYGYSSPSPSYSSYSSPPPAAVTPSRTYADNAYNQRHGRVGMAYGTAVLSASSVSCSGSAVPKTYADNRENQLLGRVGMVHGTAVHSRSTASSAGCSSAASSSVPAKEVRTYVNNPLNNRLGRVGLEVGTAVHSRSSGSTAGRTYVDNALGRRLGRPDVEHGTAVNSKSSASVKTSAPAELPVKRTYVNNAYNRRENRVGLELGTAVRSSASASTAKATSSKPKPVKVYVDNAMNRRLGRVGLPLGSMPVSRVQKAGPTEQKLVQVFLEANCVPEFFDEPDQECPDFRPLYQQVEEERQQVQGCCEEMELCDQVEGIINRHQAARSTKHVRTTVPEWLRSGHVVEFSDLEIGDRLGGGGFGDVHVAFWQGEVKVCVKKLRVQRVSETRRKQFEQEVRALSSLKHENIVSFFGACVKTPNLAIVMEFMKNGSLFDVIHMERRQYTDHQKYSLVTDMLSAVEYIHAMDMVHRDIKSMNVLICDDVTHCKLGDFGLAIRDEVETNASVAEHTVVGTMKYSPAEVLDGEKLTVEQYKAVDVYSLAVTVIELLTERKPFDGLNQHQVRRAVVHGDNEDLQLVDPAPLRNLLSRCISKQAKSRPTADSFQTVFSDAVADQ